jgi:tetraacyldisaccharide 4'-kinase
VSSVSAWFRRSWDGQDGPLGQLVLGLFLPVEAVYRGAVFLRNQCYDLGILPESESGIPVISVGNLTVGGTGKTPIASWLMTHLTTMGHRPALVTRGYGSDEVLLYGVRNPGVSVVVRKSKIKGVAQAARDGATLAILDDGFQHRAARRDVDIVLLAAEQGAQGPLLPRGRFREPLSALSRADVIIVTRKVATRDEACAVERLALDRAPEAALGQIHLEEDVWTELGSDPPREANLGPPRGDLLAVCGIAEPDGFHDLVRSKARGVVECMAFPDHHPFSCRDARRIMVRAGDRPVVITEKDAVKLRTFSKEMPKTYVLHLRVVWDSGQDAVMGLIQRALDKNP